MQSLCFRSWLHPLPLFSFSLQLLRVPNWSLLRFDMQLPNNKIQRCGKPVKFSSFSASFFFGFSEDENREKEKVWFEATLEADLASNLLDSMFLPAGVTGGLSDPRATKLASAVLPPLCKLRNVVARGGSPGQSHKRRIGFLCNNKVWTMW